MTIDLNVVVQGLTTLILAAVGRTVWQTSVNQARLDERLTAHEKKDDRMERELREDINAALGR